MKNADIDVKMKSALMLPLLLRYKLWIRSLMINFKGYTYSKDVILQAVRWYLAYVLSMLFLTSCSKVPNCHYDGQSTESANAGCLVVHDHKLLIIEDYKGRMSLPGGGIDKDPGEVPQCTAEREVWEETGIEVEAGKKIKVFSNGFQVFACDIKDNQVLDGSTRPMRFEVDEVHWISTDQFEGKSWRFPDQVEFMKEYLESYVAK